MCELCAQPPAWRRSQMLGLWTAMQAWGHRSWKQDNAALILTWTSAQTNLPMRLFLKRLTTQSTVIRILRELLAQPFARRCSQSLRLQKAMQAWGLKSWKQVNAVLISTWTSAQTNLLLARPPIVERGNPATTKATPRRLAGNKSSPGLLRH